jgi:hypothetical protein
MSLYQPKTECQDIKAIVFLIKSTELVRDRYIRKEQYELAAEAQEQIKELKESLFSILLADKFTITQQADGAIMIRGSHLKKRH